MASVLRGLGPMFRCIIGRWHAVARLFGGAAGFRSEGSASFERTHVLRGCGKYRSCASFKTMRSSYIDVNRLFWDPLERISVSWYGIIQEKSEKTRVSAVFSIGFQQSAIATLTSPFSQPAALHAQINDLATWARAIIPTRIFVAAVQDDLEEEEMTWYPLLLHCLDSLLPITLSHPPTTTPSDFKHTPTA